MEKNFKTKIFFIFLVLGMVVVGGLVGGWLYNYWFGQIASLRDLTDKKLSDLNGSLSQVIIRDAKQVVVEQDNRAAEIIVSTEKVIVGVFKKKLDNNYDLLDNVASGVLITSDGWLVANWQAKDTLVEVDDYVVITKDKKIYDLNRVVYDEFSGLTFVNLKNANSLPVAGFSPSLELKRGQTVFLLSWLKTVNPAILTESRRREDILSSDQPFKTLSLSTTETSSLVAVDLTGRVVGWLTKDKQVVSVDYIINAINYFLTNKKLTKTILGVNYLNQNYHLRDKQPVGALIVRDKKGVAVVAKSPAAVAGFKEGDIIYSINDKEIAYGVDLADVVATYQAGDKVIIKYWRGTDKKEFVVTLGGM